MPEAWFRVLKSIACCGLYILRDEIGAPQKLYVINSGDMRDLCLQGKIRVSCIDKFTNCIID